MTVNRCRIAIVVFSPKIIASYDCRNVNGPIQACNYQQCDISVSNEMKIPFHADLRPVFELDASIAIV